MPCIGRTPQGVRGLKSVMLREKARHPGSHPARGAWVEMTRTSASARSYSRRTPQGVRGLKCLEYAADHGDELVAPRKGCVG